ncbi:MAG: septal ring lytic transglycosylase RlpA family protein [Dechloromonas sp.]|nr:septal ring lytic transglycosylase RlpA family protein [Dechloromonas sp.]
MTRRRPSSSDLVRRVAALCCGLGLTLAAVAEAPSPVAMVEGLASYYGSKFHGRRTASGEVFDKTVFSAASNRFPLGSHVAVLRPSNGLCVVVRINDRMHRRHRARVIDISKSAADYLEMLQAGVVKVKVALLDESLQARGHLACADAFASPARENADAVGVGGDVGYNPSGMINLGPSPGISPP